MKIMPAFQLVPRPLTEAAKSLPSFAWAADEVGTRHQLGGEPLFLQAENWPQCPSCRERMTFLAQIDSMNDEFCIADCGMVYVFICFEDNDVASFIQSG